MSKRDKLAPLSVDPSGKLQPVGAAPKEAPVSVSPAEAPVDVVDKWIAEHPEGDNAPVAAAPSSEAVVTEKTEPKAEAPVTAEPKGVDAAPVATTTAVTAPKTQEATTTEAAPVVASAEPPKPTYAPEEKFALAEGAEWTREQIVAGLTERHKLQEDIKQLAPVKAEAEGYAQLFGMPLAQAKETWGPILKRLVAEPHTSDFIDRYLEDDGLADYLNECAVFYAQQNPGSARQAAQARQQQQPQKAAVDPVMAQQLRELSEWKAREEKARAEDRVRNEWAQATTRYPFLATDPALRQDLMATAQWMNAQDPSKGIMDALAFKTSMYEALKAAREAPAATQQPPAAQPPVPALLGSPGASPSASRATPKQPSKNDPNYDPVENWIKNPPPQFA